MVYIENNLNLTLTQDILYEKKALRYDLEQHFPQKTFRRQHHKNSTSADSKTSHHQQDELSQLLVKKTKSSLKRQTSFHYGTTPKSNKTTLTVTTNDENNGPPKYSIHVKSKKTPGILTNSNSSFATASSNKNSKPIKKSSTRVSRNTKPFRVATAKSTTASAKGNRTSSGNKRSRRDYSSLLVDRRPTKLQRVDLVAIEKEADSHDDTIKLKSNEDAATKSIAAAESTVKINDKKDTKTDEKAKEIQEPVQTVKDKKTDLAVTEKVHENGDNDLEKVPTKGNNTADANNKTLEKDALPAEAKVQDVINLNENKVVINHDISKSKPQEEASDVLKSPASSEKEEKQYQKSEPKETPAKQGLKVPIKTSKSPATMTLAKKPFPSLSAKRPHLKLPTLRVIKLKNESTKAKTPSPLRQDVGFSLMLLQHILAATLSSHTSFPSHTKPRPFNAHILIYVVTRLPLTSPYPLTSQQRQEARKKRSSKLRHRTRTPGCRRKAVKKVAAA